MSSGSGAGFSSGSSSKVPPRNPFARKAVADSMDDEERDISPPRHAKLPFTRKKKEGL